MRDLEKYICYTIAQIGEGNHKKTEMVDDLRNRGLSNEEIEAVLDIAFSRGQRLEEEQEFKAVANVLWMLSPSILMCFLLWMYGCDVITSGSFGTLIGGLIYLVKRKLQHKRFGKRM